MLVPQEKLQYNKSTTLRQLGQSSRSVRLINPNKTILSNNTWPVREIEALEWPLAHLSLYDGSHLRAMITNS
jgi:hypothetical protein